MQSQRGHVEEGVALSDETLPCPVCSVTSVFSSLSGWRDETIIEHRRELFLSVKGHHMLFILPGVVLASISSGLGEVTFLSLTAFYPR